MFALLIKKPLQKLYLWILYTEYIVISSTDHDNTEGEKNVENGDYSLPEGTHTVILGLGDMNGIMRGKRIPATIGTIFVNPVMRFGCSFCIDMTCDVWDTPM